MVFQKGYNILINLILINLKMLFLCYLLGYAFQIKPEYKTCLPLHSPATLSLVSYVPSTLAFLFFEHFTYC